MSPSSGFKLGTGAIIAIVAVLLVPFALLLGLVAASSVNTGSNITALQIGGGPIEDSKIKRCIQAGTHENFNSPGDKYVYYPLSERDWDATGQRGADSDPMRSVSSDNVEMEVPIVVRFSMVTDCTTLKTWYNEHGQRYGASLSDEGGITSGWDLALRKLVADPLDAQLDRIVQRFPWRQVWNDPAIKAEIEKQVSDQMETLVDRQARGRYFEGFTVLVKKPSPIDKELVASINESQKLLAVSEQAIAGARADVARADAEVKVARAQAAKRRAEIEGYGSTEAYLKALAVEKGLNPWQPTTSSIIADQAQ